MKKLFLLLLVVMLFGCVSGSVSRNHEIPEFAYNVNGEVWFLMSDDAQLAFILGFAAGGCELAIRVDRPDVWAAWEEIPNAAMPYRIVQDSITAYYLETERYEDSIIVVFQFVLQGYRAFESEIVPIPSQT